MINFDKITRIMDQKLADGQHRNPDPVGGPEFFTTSYFHTPDGLMEEIKRAGLSSATVYGVEGPGWSLRQGMGRPATARADLVRSRSIETEPSLIGFGVHLIAGATRP